MYGYKEYIPLTIEEVFKRVSQEDIFEICLKKQIIIDKKKATYTAPYRNDKNPSCYFEKYDNKLYFIDFGDITKKPKDCIQFLMRTLSLNYMQSLEYVNKYFSLGLGNNILTTKKIEGSFNKNTTENCSNKTRNIKTITYIPRQFNINDRIFWNKYEISRQNLIDDSVIPIELYKSTNKRGEPFIIRPIDIMYAYTEFEGGKVKIYRPKAKNKFSKWLTNCSQNDIGSIQYLPNTADLLFISKSYKDCRVIRNQGLNSVWFQNEGMIPSITIIKDLCRRFETIMVWFDNDQTGLANGKIVVDYINSIHPKKASLIFLPPKLLLEGIKDPSDLIAKKNKKELLKFLNLKTQLKNK